MRSLSARKPRNLRRPWARPRRATGAELRDRRAFFLGALAIVTGVALHLPEFIASADRGYMLMGTGASPMMATGMALIVVGLALAAYGLVRRRAALGVRSGTAGVSVRAMDSGPLTRAHWNLLTVLAVALVVDVMKPASLGFVLPDLRAEYHLSVAQAAALPLSALTGTTIGSVLWGYLADRVGRRPSILLAALIFIATAICGAMPAFTFNLGMCFVMGMSAGGMLPIVYALMAESVPADKRGWLVVVHGGLGVAGGYLVASAAADLLQPHFGWRIVWFLGLPTGALLILLNRWIPESPRFLLSRGRGEEAREVMARYGATLVTSGSSGAPKDLITDAPAPGGAVTALVELFRRPYVAQTVAIVLYGLGWGLLNWGFVTLLPTILRERGIEAASANHTLFLAALVAVPGTAVVACLYGRWSSKHTMLLYPAATVATLIAFTVVDPGAHDRAETSLGALIVILLMTSGGMIAMLSPYAAEVYPTRLRGTGSGLAAASSKVGGIFGPPLAAGILTLSPGFTALALAVAVPIALSACVLAVTGLETRGRSLEEAGTGRGTVEPPTLERVLGPAAPSMAGESHPHG